jgi:hypothetical protein
MKDVPKARERGRETPNASKRSVQDRVEFALTWLKRHSTSATREGMARYAVGLAIGWACDVRRDAEQ